MLGPAQLFLDVKSEYKEIAGPSFAKETLRRAFSCALSMQRCVIILDNIQDMIITPAGGIARKHLVDVCNEAVLEVNTQFNCDAHFV
jgi:hypothetical protein